MQTLFGSHTVYIILLSAFILTPNAKTNQNEFHNLKINFRLIQHYLAPPASVRVTSVTFPPEIHLYSMSPAPRSSPQLATISSSDLAPVSTTVLMAFTWTDSTTILLSFFSFINHTLHPFLPLQNGLFSNMQI